jgi:N12 class adenine-specific DNA methylase
MQGLEMGKDSAIEKADIFREPVAFVKIDNITCTVQEALNLSLNKFNEVDIDFISATAGSSVQQVIREFSGQIYYNPIFKTIRVSGCPALWQCGGEIRTFFHLPAAGGK